MTKDIISLSISVLLLFRHYISHKITFGSPSSGVVLCSACGAFIDKKYYNLTFLQQFYNTCYFWGKMMPMFVIHKVSIATDDDIIQFGDDVNIYPVYLSSTIIICGNCLN